MPCYEFEGLRPVVDPTAYVHPTAVLIGDAIVGPGCYVGPSASMRGDFGRLVLEEGANLQDNCTMHGFPGSTTLVKKNGHIGHGAVLHGCVIGENALVGMNAVVMDGAEIGDESIVAALAFVRAGFIGEPRQLLVGSPAKPIRTLSDKDVAWKSKGTLEYQALAQRCLTSLHEVTPLNEMEPDRPRLKARTDVSPLHQTKNK